MSVEIRVLRPDERAVLDRVAPDVFDHAIDPRWSAEFFEDPRHHLAVALDGALVVGFASAVHYVHPDKPPELWINEVGVAPSHQRQGLGRRLLETLLRHGGTLGCVQAWVLTSPTNAAAQKLYAVVGGKVKAEPSLLFEFSIGLPDERSSARPAMTKGSAAESEMHQQLQAILDEFGTAQKRLHALAAAAPASAWSRRADPNRWSIAECVAHLNLTSAAFLPPLQQALAGRRGARRTAGTRFHRDPIGWLLWRMAGPPVRLRVKTTAPFIPQATATAEELVTAFDQWQARLVALVQEAEGSPLSQLWMTSPVDARLRYTVYSCLTILPRHQHRHLWQAEQVWAALRGSGGAQ